MSDWDEWDELNEFNWFKEQIRARRRMDDEAFQESFYAISGAILGENLSDVLEDQRALAQDAMEEILKYHRIRMPEIPNHITDPLEMLDYCLEPHGMMYRTVHLNKGWQRHSMGAMLAFDQTSGDLVALIPDKRGFGYQYYNKERQKRCRLTAELLGRLGKEALLIYKPFPLKKLSLSGVLSYLTGVVPFSDYLIGMGLTGLTVLIGLFLPGLVTVLFGQVLAEKSVTFLLAVTLCMISLQLAQLLFRSLETVYEDRISLRMQSSAYAAGMMRLLSLPASFFKSYSSGELHMRLESLRELAEVLVQLTGPAVISSLFSLGYVGVLVHYTPVMAGAALGILFAGFALTVGTAFLAIRIETKRLELNSKTSAMTYAMISGIAKIRLSGSEKRSFARFGRQFAEEATVTYHPPLVLRLRPALIRLVELLGGVLLYMLAIREGLSVEVYLGFISAYGFATEMFNTLSQKLVLLTRLKPSYEMARPILETVPEIDPEKQTVTSLSGGIELNNVSFRYAESMPLILNDLSLKIYPGEYVAIAGLSGSGKSTLMRIMLGFETPRRGAVYYDGRDMSTLNLKSLRSRIGVVMQNGRLFSGDIYSNIVVSAPNLTLDEAWEAAELAGSKRISKPCPWVCTPWYRKETAAFPAGRSSVF